MKIPDSILTAIDILADVFQCLHVMYLLVKLSRLLLHDVEPAGQFVQLLLLQLHQRMLQAVGKQSPRHIQCSTAREESSVLVAIA